MNKASEAILALKPVTFRYKQEFNPNHTPMFGLIAEEVEKVNPNLVTRNNKGEAETVRYDAINAMLLNEFLKTHKKMEEQEKTIAELKSSVEILTAQVRQQSEQIQKVSASVGLNRAGSELAANR